MNNLCLQKSCDFQTSNSSQSLQWAASHQSHATGAQGPPTDDITQWSCDPAGGRAREEGDSGDPWQYSPEQRERQRSGDNKRNQQRLPPSFLHQWSLMNRFHSVKRFQNPGDSVFDFSQILSSVHGLTICLSSVTTT